MDLHKGNYGIRNITSIADMKIVIYDFGQMCDICKFPQHKRIKFVKNKMECDIDGIMDVAEVSLNVKHVINYNEFAADFEALAKYIIINNVSVPKEIKMIMLSWSKITGLAKNMLDVINLPDMQQYKHKNLYKDGFHHYITNSFPYDEFKPLAEIFMQQKIEKL